MHYLYHGGGADITDIGGPLVSDDEWQRTRVAASRLLNARSQTIAANLLTRVPFAWVTADNFFGDEFSVLQAVVPVEEYVALQEAKTNKTIQHPFEAIAKTISEISPSRPFVRFVVVTLDSEDGSSLSVAPPSPKITSESVDSALADAELLARSRGPSSAVDRAHTAVHAYLRAALLRSGVEPGSRSSATELLKQLRDRAPRLQALVDGGEEAKRIVMALASIIDAAGTLRNNSSAAHPTASILQTPEAMLVINAAKSLIHYLDAKLDDST